MEANTSVLNLVETQATEEVTVSEQDENYFIKISFGLSKVVTILPSEARRFSTNADLVQFAAQRAGITVPDNAAIVRKGENGGVVSGDAEPPMENAHFSIATSSGKGGAA
jgi:hypothetical protein